jgi:hypothetical protein
MPGRRSTATILKLIRGEQRPARLKDDGPKLDVPDARPALEPPAPTAYTRLSRDLWRQLGVAFGEIA